MDELTDTTGGQTCVAWPPSRAMRVREVRALVLAGRYRVDLERLADRILMRIQADRLSATRLRPLVGEASP